MECIGGPLQDVVEEAQQRQQATNIEWHMQLRFKKCFFPMQKRKGLKIDYHNFKPVLVDIPSNPPPKPACSMSVSFSVDCTTGRFKHAFL